MKYVYENACLVPTNFQQLSTILVWVLNMFNSSTPLDFLHLNVPPIILTTKQERLEPQEMWGE